MMIPPLEILSDRGIRQALAHGFISVKPGENIEVRIQPASLDVCASFVDDREPFSADYPRLEGSRLTLSPGMISTVSITDEVEHGSHPTRLSKYFIGWTAEAKSTLRRLGVFAARCGAAFPPTSVGYGVELGNFNSNPIHLYPQQPIAQLLFTVRYQNPEFLPQHHEAALQELWPRIQTLDRGVELQADTQIQNIMQQGFFTVSPRLMTYGGKVLVHASSHAYRMRSLKGGIDCNKLKSYSSETLLEPISLDGGYTVKPGDHLVIETLEQLELSRHIGIRFWDNWHFADDLPQGRTHMDSLVKLMSNSHFVYLSDGWVDPGYKGGFSRQPKWLTGRTIHPGDVLGFGQVFYFEKGVEFPYGHSSLNSHHQGKKGTEIS